MYAAISGEATLADVDTSLAVLLVSSGAVVTSLAGALAAWLRARRFARVTIKVGGAKLEISSVNVEQAEQVIEAFLSRQREEGRGSAE